MSRFEALARELDVCLLAERITIPHDSARVSYRLVKNTVADAREFADVIGDYYSHHCRRCVTPGGTMPRYRAIQAAKRIVSRACERQNKRYANAIADAINGTNGGMSAILDRIADELKAEDREDYIADVLHRHTAYDSFAEKLVMIRDAFAYFGSIIPQEIRGRPPEDFVTDYRMFLRDMLDMLESRARLGFALLKT